MFFHLVCFMGYYLFYDYFLHASVRQPQQVDALCRSVQLAALQVVNGFHSGRPFGSSIVHTGSACVVEADRQRLGVHSGSGRQGEVGREGGLPSASRLRPPCRKPSRHPASGARSCPPGPWCQLRTHRSDAVHNDAGAASTVTSSASNVHSPSPASNTGLLAATVAVSSPVTTLFSSTPVRL